MPFTSKKQKKTIDAAAHNPAFAKKVGIKVSDAKKMSGHGKGQTKFQEATTTVAKDKRKTEKMSKPEKEMAEAFETALEGSIRGGVWTSQPADKGQKDVPPPQEVDGGILNKKQPKPVNAPRGPKKAEIDQPTQVASTDDDTPVAEGKKKPSKIKVAMKNNKIKALKENIKLVSQLLAEAKKSGKCSCAKNEDTCKVHSKMKEGAKPDFLDMDKDGDKKEPMKKAVADKGDSKTSTKKGMSDKQAKYFGKKTVKEGSMKDLMHKDAERMSRAAFCEKYGDEHGEFWDNIMGEIDESMSRAAKGHEKYGKPGMKALAKAGREGASEKKLDTIRNKHDKYDDKVDEVAGAQKCWPGHKKVGTQPGTGKNAGKRVNDCEKIKEATKPLKGGQKKLDTDKDGDIDAKDMANLRAKKKAVKESTDLYMESLYQKLQNQLNG